MKKVRFESPKKGVFGRMDESECHSPRPLIERQALAQAPDFYECKRVVYSRDPVHRFDYSDSSPYPLAKKTFVPASCTATSDFLPSNDLNLSMLDEYEPRQCKPAFVERISVQPNVLSPIENTVTPPNILRKDNSFFIRRENLDKYNFNINPLQKDLNRLSLDKENGPLARKAELARMTTDNMPCLPDKVYLNPAPSNTVNNECSCHHCIKSNNVHQYKVQAQKIVHENVKPETIQRTNLPPPCQPQIISCFYCQEHVQQIQNVCHCNTQNTPIVPHNAVDKKTWAIERFEQEKKTGCTEVEKQKNIAKEKREPTIADLVKIIKLQNEQLQLLQEKVDKFIITSNSQQQKNPVQNYLTEHVALQTVDSEHKISIGVMTSFEMVCTSTIINKEILKQKDNAQIQCNRSQISIKEMVSNHPGNLNFLDGIAPVGLSNPQSDFLDSQSAQENGLSHPNGHPDEKTLNELSLCNVQVDNATTPQLSPDQTLYLDVRDYSDSDSVSSDDQSNVGWTYYNKVMTHVNGLLQDSDMPSSASALYRNTRQQCVQMQIDKTNVSVTKRVKFGDDPVGTRQKQVYTASTDTSLRMNQLAAKYLYPAPAPLPARPANHIDMSFATRNYMERHKLLQGIPGTSRSPPASEIPRFLDITALKQQPKLL